jgi:hypothetical protein
VELLDQRGGGLRTRADFLHADGELGQVVGGPHNPLPRVLRAVGAHQLLQTLAADVDGLILALLEEIGFHIYQKY